MDNDKTTRISAEEQLRVAVGHIRELERRIAALEERILELQGDLALFSADESSLAVRCKALEKMNFELLARIRSNAQARALGAALPEPPPAGPPGV